jgi:succinate dehydrogenase / fumarate reductase cytochrome b subunit
VAGAPPAAATRRSRPFFAGPRKEGNDAVNKQRPVNLDLGTIALPVTARVSILHRASGVFLFAGIAVLLYLLDLSLGDAGGFQRAAALLATTPAKLLLWVVLAALIYHAVAGVKHLLMDLGIGESLEGGVLAARVTLGIAGVLILAAGVWLW